VRFVSIRSRQTQSETRASLLGKRELRLRRCPRNSDAGACCRVTSGGGGEGGGAVAISKDSAKCGRKQPAAATAIPRRHAPRAAEIPGRRKIGKQQVVGKLWSQVENTRSRYKFATQLSFDHRSEPMAVLRKIVGGLTCRMRILRIARSEFHQRKVAPKPR